MCPREDFFFSTILLSVRTMRHSMFFSYSFVDVLRPHTRMNGSWHYYVTTHVYGCSLGKSNETVLSNLLRRSGNLGFVQNIETFGMQVKGVGNLLYHVEVDEWDNRSAAAFRFLSDATFVGGTGGQSGLFEFRFGNLEYPSVVLLVRIDRRKG